MSQAIQRSVLTILILSFYTLYGCENATSTAQQPKPVTTSTVNEPRYDSLPPPFDIDVTYTRTLFVDGKHGPHGDGTGLKPYNTIRQALDNATPGTRIRVAAGTYNTDTGLVSNLQGSRDAPIALVANGKVVLDTHDGATAMVFRDARYLVIDGFTIQNTGIHGMNIDDGGSFDTPSEHIILRNMHFRNIGKGGNNDCLKMSGVKNFYITASEFESCNQGEAIDMVGCHNGIITGNYFHDIIRVGVQTKGGSADILIHGNRFENVKVRAINAGGHTNNKYFRPIDSPYEARRIQIVANIFKGTELTPLAFAGCDTCIFANNTIVNPRKHIAWIVEQNRTKQPGRNGYFINNLITFRQSDMSSYSFVKIGANALPNTYTFGWNLWYATDTNNFTGPPYRGSLPAEKHAVIQKNPLLIKDYSINASSPAIGQGRVVPRGIPSDFRGRKYASPPSIGAFAAPQQAQ